MTRMDQMLKEPYIRAARKALMRKKRRDLILTIGLRLLAALLATITTTMWILRGIR